MASKMPNMASKRPEDAEVQRNAAPDEVAVLGGGEDDAVDLEHGGRRGQQEAERGQQKAGGRRRAA